MPTCHLVKVYRNQGCLQKRQTLRRHPAPSLTRKRSLFRGSRRHLTTASTALHLEVGNMSPSSTGDSPDGLTGNGSRLYLPSTHDNFTIEVPSAQLTPIPNGIGKAQSLNHKTQRTSSFGRDAILGAAPKTRHISQASESFMNGSQKVSSDEGSNPLKRKNTDTTIDYPRRRATIAVRSATFLASAQTIQVYPSIAPFR